MPAVRAQLDVDAAGHATFSGRVGIGTAPASTARLYVQFSASSASAYGLHIEGTGTTAATAYGLYTDMDGTPGAGIGVFVTGELPGAARGGHRYAGHERLRLRSVQL